MEERKGRDGGLDEIDVRKELHNQTTQTFMTFKESQQGCDIYHMEIKW